jgi:hypothetical protein
MSDEKTTHRHVNNQLDMFNGTQQYYLHMSGYMYTDGVKFLADQFHTYWLLNEILFKNRPTAFEEFQVWKLERLFTTDQMPTDQFVLTCEDGDKTPLYTKRIPFSDFDGDSVELWFCNSVLYLPSEH